MEYFDYFKFYSKWISDIVTNEEEYFNQSDIPYELKKDYLECIIPIYETLQEKKILNNNTKIVLQIDRNNQKREYQTMTINEILDCVDTFAYQKPWAKLKEFHKINKIKEYIKELEYDTSDNTILNDSKIKKNKNKLFNELWKLIQSKKINQKQIIEYNHDKCKIDDISCIVYNDDTKLYEIVI
jgi:hypothetical protein